MRRMSVLLAIASLILIITFGITNQIPARKNMDSGLSLTAKIEVGVKYTVKNIPIGVVFLNSDDQVTRLLNVFEKPKALPVFFSFNLTDAEGTPVQTLGGGKIALSKNSMRYIELRKNEKYSLILNLKEFIPSDISLKPGAYNVSVKYHNQYGEDCFKGNLESNTISLYLSE